MKWLALFLLSATVTTALAQPLASVAIPPPAVPILAQYRFWPEQFN